MAREHTPAYFSPTQQSAYQRKVRAHVRTRRAQADVGEIVYYVAFDDGTVKIGYTVNLVNRLQALRRTLASVLAVEPGGSDVEAIRHQQFASHLVDGEYFDLGPDLVEHINQIRAKVGMPPVVRT